MAKLLRSSRNAAIAAVATAVGLATTYALLYWDSDYTSDSSFGEPYDAYFYRTRHAEALLNGDGVPQNFLQAKAEFEAIERATNLRDNDPKDYRGRASQRIAEIYYNGLGVPKDTVMAAEWFRKAAQSGKTVGPGPALMLGTFFEHGIAGKRDLVEAYRWYNVAAGTPYESQETLINMDKHAQLTALAKTKRAELATRLTTDELNRAQRSPFQPPSLLDLTEQQLEQRNRTK